MSRDLILELAQDPMLAYAGKARMLAALVSHLYSSVCTKPGPLNYSCLEMPHH